MIMVLAKIAVAGLHVVVHTHHKASSFRLKCGRAAGAACCDRVAWWRHGIMIASVRSAQRRAAGGVDDRRGVLASLIEQAADSRVAVGGLVGIRHLYKKRRRQERVSVSSSTPPRKRDVQVAQYSPVTARCVGESRRRKSR